MSAQTRRDGGNPRIDAQKDIVGRITRVCSLLLPNDGGIHVRFINNNARWDKMNEATVLQNMATVRPSGGTRIGTSLHEKVLDPYVYQKLDAGLETPYLICVITDGCPSGEDEHVFAEKLQDCIEKVTSHPRGYGDKGKPSEHAETSNALMHCSRDFHCMSDW